MADFIDSEAEVSDGSGSDDQASGSEAEIETQPREKKKKRMVVSSEDEDEEGNDGSLLGICFVVEIYRGENPPWKYKFSHFIANKAKDQ